MLRLVLLRRESAFTFERPCVHPIALASPATAPPHSYNSAMLFDSLAVVGVGRIGGSVGLAALKRYVELVPDSPNIKQIEAACVSLGGTCVPKPAKKR